MRGFQGSRRVTVDGPGRAGLVTTMRSSSTSVSETVRSTDSGEASVVG